MKVHVLSLLSLFQESSLEACVICEKVATSELLIPVPLSELDVLLSLLLLRCSVLNKTRRLQEQIEGKGCREGAEKECREPDLGLKSISLLLQAPYRRW